MSVETDIQVLARRIKMPVKTWPNHCYLVVAALLQHRVVDADPVTGCYHSGVDMVWDHAWFRLPDGQVFDPTKWAMDEVPPYVYVGPETDSYDEDGLRWLAERQAVFDMTFGPGSETTQRMTRFRERLQNGTAWLEGGQ